MVFDIGVEEEKIGERREYPAVLRSKDLALSRSGRPRDDSPRKKERKETMTTTMMTTNAAACEGLGESKNMRESTGGNV